MFASISSGNRGKSKKKLEMLIFLNVKLKYKEN